MGAVARLLLLLLPAASPLDAPSDGFDPNGIPSDALGAIAQSGRVPIKSTVTADGKRGMITLAPSPPTSWSPKYMVSGSDVREMVESEQQALVFCFSSDEEFLGKGAEDGKEFESAVGELIEGETTFSFGMVDVKRYPLVGEICGVKGGRGFTTTTLTLFKAGSPTLYEGPFKSPAIIAWVRHLTAPPTTFLHQPEQLDSLLSTSELPVVVAVFAGGSKAQSKTPSGIARGHFLASADQMRGVFVYVEMSSKTANAAALFQSSAPFVPATSTFAVVRPARWVTKAEEPFLASHDFKGMHRFLLEHAWPLVQPFSNGWTARCTREKKAQVVLLFEMASQANKLRYVLRQYHKLIHADANFSQRFSFSMVDPSKLPAALEARFESSLINGAYVSSFGDEAKAFMLLVFNASSGQHWVNSALVGTTADSLDAARFTGFLQGILIGEEKPLIQGDAAAEAAGLKKMSFGLDGMSDASAGDSKRVKKRKKKKSLPPKKEL